MAKNFILPLPLPLLGLNTVDSSIDITSGYARELTNYSLVNGRLYMRPGSTQKIRNAGLTAAGRYVVWYDPNSNEAILDNGSSYNLSTGALAFGGTAPVWATTCKHLSLDLVFFGAGTPRNAKASYAAWAFNTVAPIVGTSISGGCSHKGRLYVHELHNVNYSTVGQVLSPPNLTGISFGEFLTGRSREAIVSAQEPICRMFSTTMSSVSSENVLVIFGSFGTVLVYAGLDPASASWSLIAKWSMPTPINPQCFLELDGDILVGTTEYAYWFRDLFQGGAQTAYANSPTKAIEGFYAANAASSATYGTPIKIGITYLQSEDVILFRLMDEYDLAHDKLAGYDTDLITLAYYRKYKAWSVWMSPPFDGPFIIGPSGFVYATTKEAQILYTDRAFSWRDIYSTGSLPIQTSWKTPYSKYSGRASAINGNRLFYESFNLGNVYKIRSIFDYSDYNAPFGWFSQDTAVTPTTPINYADSSAPFGKGAANQYNTLIGVGGRGGAFSLQYSFKEESAVPGLYTSPSIYGSILYMQDGGESF